MFLPDSASFVSALLFAVHPIHTEAVSIGLFSKIHDHKKKHDKL